MSYSQITNLAILQRLGIFLVFTSQQNNIGIEFHVNDVVFTLIVSPVDETPSAASNTAPTTSSMI